MRILLLLALSLPLAGCFSVTGPKPVPEWAMNPQGGDASVEPQRRAAAHRQRAPQPEVARETTETTEPAVGLAAATTDNRMTDATLNALRPSGTQLAKPVVRRKPTALPSGTETSKTPEADWHAHDAEVSRSINSICRGC